MKVGTPQAAAQQNRTGVAHRGHAGNSGEPVSQIAIESGHALALVSREHGVHIECQQIAGGEPRIETPQVLQCMYHQPRAHHHDDSQRHLRNHQNISQAESTLPAAQTARAIF